MVLVVDDDQAIRDTLEILLSGRGYLVDTAASGEQALTMLAEKQHAVVILDLRMPGMGGMGFLEQYEQVSPQSRVVILTGYPEAETAVSALSGGAFAKAIAYLTKPAQPAQLYSLIEENLSGIAVDGWQADIRVKEGFYNGRPIEIPEYYKDGTAMKMTVAVFDIFLVFMRHPNIALNYQQLYRLVYGTKASDLEAATSALKSHVWRLRKMMEHVAGREVISSKAGLGFIFSP